MRMKFDFPSCGILAPNVSRRMKKKKKHAIVLHVKLHIVAIFFVCLDWGTYNYMFISVHDGKAEGKMSRELKMETRKEWQGIRFGKYWCDL